MMMRYTFKTIIFYQVGGWVAGVAVVCGGDLSIFNFFHDVMVNGYWICSYGVMVDIFLHIDDQQCKGRREVRSAEKAVCVSIGNSPETKKKL